MTPSAKPPPNSLRSSPTVKWGPFAAMTSTRMAGHPLPPPPHREATPEGAAHRVTSLGAVKPECGHVIVTSSVKTSELNDIESPRRYSAQPRPFVGFFSWTITLHWSKKL